jgi:pseudouridine synthase
VQREYLATVDIDVGVNENEEEKKRKEADFEAALRAKLAAGVKTADGIYEARLLEVMHRKKIEDDEVNSIEEEKGAEGRRSNAREELVLRVGVSEGKHRMVRRLLANAGYPVVALHRVRYGHISLGTLSEGEVTEIKAQSEGGQWARRLLGS